MPPPPLLLLLLPFYHPPPGLWDDGVSLHRMNPISSGCGYCHIWVCFSIIRREISVAQIPLSVSCQCVLWSKLHGRIWRPSYCCTKLFSDPQSHYALLEVIVENCCIQLFRSLLLRLSVIFLFFAIISCTYMSVEKHQRWSPPLDCYFAYLSSFTKTLMKLSQKYSSNLPLLM